MLCVRCMLYKSRNDSGRLTAYVRVYSSKVRAVLTQSGLSDLSLYLRDCSPFSGSVRNTTAETCYICALNAQYYHQQKK